MSWSTWPFCHGQRGRSRMIGFPSHECDGHTPGRTRSRGPGSDVAVLRPAEGFGYLRPAIHSAVGLVVTLILTKRLRR